MNIIQAIKDDRLFKPFLGDLRTWNRWQIALRALYGLPIKRPANRKLIRECTGRTSLPADGFDSALFVTGRRSGKSRVAAIVGAYEASLSGKEKRLAKGELGMVVVVSPTKLQSQIVKSYLRGIYDTPLLSQEIIQEDKEGFQLRNGVRIQILTGDFRAVRGFTLLAAVVDEAAFHTSPSAI